MHSKVVLFALKYLLCQWSSIFILCSWKSRGKSILEKRGGHPDIQCKSKKSLRDFLPFFPKRLGIFSPNDYTPIICFIYAILQIFIQLN